MLLKSISGSGAAAATYVDDVFSTWLYTGNGSAQTITNGINLSGKGGLVWVKQRDTASNHILCDTVRGADNFLMSDAASAQSNTSGQTISAFSTTGFSVGNYAYVNQSTKLFTSWTFRKASKFFDIVTWTGDGGTSGRTITHALGATPALIIAKKTSGTSQDWYVYHRSLAGGTNPYFLILNSTAAQDTGGGIWGDPAGWTSTTFTTRSGTSALNTNAETYVAYLFAHDTTSDGLIQCGSYTGNGSASGQSISLGWEPQFLLVKDASVNGGTQWGWHIFDTARGFTAGPTTTTNSLMANSSSAENAFSSAYPLSPTSTGFTLNNSNATFNASGDTYIYLAIRRPNKPPTSGTQVYNAIARNGTNALAVVTGVGFRPDLILNRQRTTDYSGNGQATVWDRLRGAYQELVTSSTTAEVSRNGVTGFDVMDGYEVSDPVAHGDMNYASGNPEIAWNFRRAPGVFDVVCYTAVGNALLTLSHNLGAVPELAIFKTRSTTSDWYTFHIPNNFNRLFLNLTNAGQGNAGGITSASATNLALTANDVCNITNGTTYVAYLFATKAGISKVGSYTGNGSSQTINCGFSAGARFVLIKRTDTTGDWYVWDSARGIVAGNDPYVPINRWLAEVTTDDSIDPDNSGFVVNQVAATNINVNTATYIYLAFA